MIPVAMPLLAQYKNRSVYIPQYGDYIIWSGWLSTWHGFVTNYDKKTDRIDVIFSGLPFLLLTMDEKDYERETYQIELQELRQAKNGKYAIQQQAEDKSTVWFI